MSVSSIIAVKNVLITLQQREQSDAQRIVCVLVRVLRYLTMVSLKLLLFLSHLIFTDDRLHVNSPNDNLAFLRDVKLCVNIYDL